MIASSQAERMLTDWLGGRANGAGSEDVLQMALSRVAATGQERYVTQRVFGDDVGRSYRLRTALAVAVLAVALLGAVVVGAALLRREPPPPEPPPAASNGLIAFAANGEAGDNLEVTEVGRSGDRDIYVVEAGAAPRRIIGTGVDGWHQGCPVFLAGGRQLAYVELEISSLARSQLPYPADQTPPPAPPTPTSKTPIWAIVVVEFDEGNAGARLARVVVEASGMSCPTWAPDGRQFAYSVGTEGNNSLWVSTLDGSRERLLATSQHAIRGLDWSPRGTTLAVADGYGQRVGFAPVDGGEPTWIAALNAHSVAWSPDGRQLAVGADRAIEVFDASGTRIATLRPDVDVEQAPTPATTPKWSPDGRWLAWFDKSAALVRAKADGTATATREVEGITPGDYPSVVRWAPDGASILVSTGGFDTPGALISVPWDASSQPTVLVPPTYALRGVAVDWQAVYP